MAHLKMKMKFPSISRKITEKWVSFSKNYKVIKTYGYFSIASTVLISIILILIIIFVVFIFLQNFAKYQDLNAKRAEISSKINFWQDISVKYSGYPDAYFNIAVLYFELSDLKKSREYFEKTLILNPNYQKASDLDKALREKGY